MLSILDVTLVAPPGAFLPLHRRQVDQGRRQLREIYRLAIVTGCLLAFQTMPTRYREVLEYMQGYRAAYPLGFEADETGQQYIVADRNGYRLGESADLALIEETVKGENEAFTNNMQRKTFRELIAMFAS